MLCMSIDVKHTDRSEGTTVWKGKFQKMIIFTNRPTEDQMQSIAEFLKDEI